MLLAHENRRASGTSNSFLEASGVSMPQSPQVYHAASTPFPMTMMRCSTPRSSSAVSQSTNDPAMAEFDHEAASLSRVSTNQAVVAASTRAGSEGFCNSNSHLRSGIGPLSIDTSFRRESSGSRSVPTALDRRTSSIERHTLSFDTSRKSWFETVVERRSRRFWRRMCFWWCSLAIFVFCFALAFILPRDVQHLAPVVIGITLSLLSALLILVSYMLQTRNRRYPNELLVYVALCELGLALAVLMHVVMYCSDTTTTSDGVQVYFCKPMPFRSCSIINALEMFFTLASVGWFGAAIMHLFVSVSNPFANYKSQLKKYHVSVWGGSIVISAIVPLIVFGKSMQDKYKMSGVEICRAVSLTMPMLPEFSDIEDQQQRVQQWKQLNLAYWGTLFALVVLMVMAAQSILVVGWWRSNSGTVIALKARRRMMKRMTIYVHTLNFTWLVILVAYFTYRSSWSALERLSSSDSNLASAQSGINILDAVFHFILTAKGFFTCVVWVNVNKSVFAPNTLLCCEPLDDDSSCDEAPTDTDFIPAGWSASSMEAENARQRAESRTRASSMPRRYTGGSATGASQSVSSAPASSWASQNNETLQREIIYYTVCGITKAILKSSKSEDTDVFFQQLLVGADRDSTFFNDTMLSDMQILDLLQSPRAFCQTMPPARPSTILRSHTQPVDSAESTVSMTSAQNFLRNHSFMGPGDAASSTYSNRFRASQGSARSSLYPVTHVPFELFEQEIELQSNRSSSSSFGLTPLFAGLRRTAIAWNQPSKSVDDPKPKRFIDYAPNEFRTIRRAFGMSDESYLASFRTTAKERISAGSSGAFLFFSGDDALIVKSMKEKECRKLVSMIPAYTDYIQSNPKSRIIRFFGCHRIRLYGRNFYFVVMTNVLHSVKHTATITEKYDVKGSWIDRRAKLPQVGDMVTCSECHASYQYGRNDNSSSLPLHVHRPDTILKDLDLTRALHLSEDVAESLYHQLFMDCEFLNSMGIMDYSLLVGVHKCRLPETWMMHNHHHYQYGVEYPAEDISTTVSSGQNLEPIPGVGQLADEVYFVGIIDILQEWDFEKQMEKVGKVLIGKSSRGISAMAPEAYCQRFKARLRQVLKLEKEELDIPSPSTTPTSRDYSDDSPNAQQSNIELDHGTGAYV